MTLLRRLRPIVATLALLALAPPYVVSAFRRTEPTYVVSAFRRTVTELPPATSELAQLRGMQELKAWFNASKGRPRLLLLLSPT